MKKRFSIIALLILSLGFVSAIPILTLNKKNPQPGETLIGGITGNFVEGISEIKFYEGRKQVFFEYDLVFYNDAYFFYIYMTREGNFTIKIDNVLYRAPELKSINIEEQIEVKKNFLDENKTKTQILSIKPGFVYTSNNAKITLSNKGSENINISYNSEYTELGPQDFEEIEFIPQKLFSYLEIKSYEIFNVPIIYIPLDSNFTGNNYSPIKLGLKSNASSIVIKAIARDKTIEIITLTNIWDFEISEIDLRTNLSILEFDNIKNIKTNSSEELELEFYSKDPGIFRDFLIIDFTQNESRESLRIPVNVYVFPKDTNKSTIESRNTSCKELGGEICLKNQNCTTINTITDYGEYCCLGACKDPEAVEPEETWMRTVAGIIIFVILGAIIFGIYKKYKKARPMNPKESLEKTSDRYQKRISGGLSRT